MNTEELTLFFDYVKIGFSFGLGIWLVSFGLHAAWVAFRTAIKS